MQLENICSKNYLFLNCIFVWLRTFEYISTDGATVQKTKQFLGFTQNLFQSTVEGKTIALLPLGNATVYERKLLVSLKITPVNKHSSFSIKLFFRRKKSASNQQKMGRKLFSFSYSVLH